MDAGVYRRWAHNMSRRYCLAHHHGGAAKGLPAAGLAGWHLHGRRNLNKQNLSVLEIVMQ